MNDGPTHRQEAATPKPSRRVRRLAAAAADAQALTGEQRALLTQAERDPAVVAAARRSATRAARTRVNTRARLSNTAYTALADRAASAGTDLAYALRARSAEAAPRAVTVLSRVGLWGPVAMLAMSLLLSGGSGYGIAMVATVAGGAAATGFIVELGGSVISTATITTIGLVARYSASGYAIATRTRGRKLLVGSLIVGPLLMSIVLNLLGLAFGFSMASVISALCAVGAAGTALAAHAITVMTSEARTERADQIGEQDAADLLRVATDTAALDRLVEPPTLPAEALENTSPAPSDAELVGTALLGSLAEGDREQLAGLIADDEALLDKVMAAIARVPESPAAWGGATGGTGPDQGEQPAATPVAAPGGGTGPVPADLHEHPDNTADEPAEGGGTGGTGADQQTRPPHLQARAAQGASTRQAVLDYIQTHGPGVSTNQIAADLGKARSTVREHRDRLHQDGHQVYDN
ncbi:hypothetical protein O4J56_06870 [Nocardiopsis sp. RSe5-2]|uniref:Uncharacterized protein n=1 Tax=Nocardiopsis endophytica TaxID=3018445 RepID=A0ABT4U1V7_9ACTN|nr:hypothetical protein [Nocardiopsis endophytica]MDA2810357.1 hypothetical protein [Nocardiopsis endophytica]